MVADVIARALVVLGVDARHGTPGRGSARRGPRLRRASSVSRLTSSWSGPPTGGPGPRRRRAAATSVGAGCGSAHGGRRLAASAAAPGPARQPHAAGAGGARPAGRRRVEPRGRRAPRESPRTRPGPTCRTCSPSCRSRAGWPLERSPAATGTSRAGPEAWRACSSPTRTGSSAALLPSSSARRATTSSTRRPRCPRSGPSTCSDVDLVLSSSALAETGCLLSGRRDGHRPRLVVLSPVCEHERLLGALEAGAQGYLGKDAGLEELLAGIAAVLRGEAVRPPGDAGRPAARARAAPPHGRLAEPDAL